MNELFKTIQESFNLLDLEDDWDDDRAVKVNEKAFCNAHHFLNILIKKIGSNIIVPEINPLRDGSIDITWRNENNGYRLLICFHEDHLSLYGDNGDNGDVQREKLDITSNKAYPEDLKLFNWIAENFKTN